MHDAPKKSAVPAEPMKKQKNGEMQDTGSPVSITNSRRCPCEESYGSKGKFLVTQQKREKGNHKK